MRRPVPCAAAAAALILAVTANAGQAETMTLRAGGAARSAEILAPADSAGLPLLILLHGRFGTGAQILRDSAIRPGRFVLAAPDGHRRSWASGRGRTPADQDGVDDVAFLRGLVAELVARRGIDPARVYVAGMSNGGFMAGRLACEAPGLVAGIAILGATTGRWLAAACPPGRPVSVLLIHGTADPLVGVDGSAPPVIGAIMAVQEALRFWAGREGCAAASRPRALPHAGPPDGTAAWRSDFAPCRSGARVTFIEVRGGGHAWPGAPNRLPERIVGPPTYAIHAGAEILGFFGLASN